MASYADHYRNIDFRKYPEKYVIGKGEQGVLIAEPYKSEILPFWKFATPELAKTSAEKIYNMFLVYRDHDDFVGMDMSRKFLQMGYTRSRRYANHAGGKKYDGPVPLDKKGQSGAHGRQQLPKSPEDPIKAESARIFFEFYGKVRNDTMYQQALKVHKEKYE